MATDPTFVPAKLGRAPLPTCPVCERRCNRLHLTVSWPGGQPLAGHVWHICSLLCLSRWAENQLGEHSLPNQLPPSNAA